MDWPLRQFAQISLPANTNIRNAMNKYNIIKQLGDGSFGSVLQAQNIETHEKVFLCLENQFFQIPWTLPPCRDVDYGTKNML